MNAFASLRAVNVSKTYGWRSVLNNVSIEAHSGQCLCIAGPNGSGKSTFLKILCGLLRYDSGSVESVINNDVISDVRRPFHIGMVAPYLQVYDEFTPAELIQLQQRMHGEHSDRDHVLQTLARVGLADRADETVRTLSSGLRQRVILALAIHRKPAFLMLDEPTNTLDAEGRQIVEREVQLHQQRNGVVVIATNDDWEKQLCTHFIEFGSSASSVSV